MSDLLVSTLPPVASNPAAALAAQNAAAPFRLKSPPSLAQTVPQFKPLFSGGLPTKTIPGSSPPATAARPACAAKEPQVNVKRDGDRVSHITITCGCGQRIELACEY